MDIKNCPFCQAPPIKDIRSSANGYIINHKNGCLLENLFKRIQDGTTTKWQNRNPCGDNKCPLCGGDLVVEDGHEICIAPGSCTYCEEIEE